MDTARLWIRTLASSDERLYCTLYRDPATMRFIGAPMSAARAARSFRAALAAGRKLPVDDLFLAFVEKATRAPIGMGSLQHFDRTRRRAAAGIMLLPAKQAQGYAKEAFAAMLHLAFAVLALEEIWIEFSVDHSAARRVAAAVGLSRSGRRRPPRGTDRRQIWSICRASWLSLTTCRS
jgi:RimJ/RimL family protein N-acetyltransferase